MAYNSLITLPRTTVNGRPIHMTIRDVTWDHTVLPATMLPDTSERARRRVLDLLTPQGWKVELT